MTHRRQAAPFSKDTTAPHPRRPGHKAGAAYAALVCGVQASPVVAPDETGWRVDGQRAWLWAFAGDGMTVYRRGAP
jgi:hypothetical protein